MAVESLKNAAAWQKKPTVGIFEVDNAPVTRPPEGYILVQTAAVAINPVDVAVQKVALFPVDYPAILGEDVAGLVVAVGPGVTRFKTGDRVLGFATGLTTKEPAYGAFQSYTLIIEGVASHIPATLHYSKAATLPLALATAGLGLFGESTLNLPCPSLNPTPISQILLIWGGSSSVGGSAVQLAKATGLDVITTASPRNHNAVKQLGPVEVFDHTHENAVEQIITFLKRKQLAGILDASGTDSGMSNCVNIAANAEGNRTVICVRKPPEVVPVGVTVKDIWALDIVGTSAAQTVFEDYIPAALAQDVFKAIPEPEVVGRGLECIQKGLDTLENGVSFKKVVVELEQAESP